MSSFKRGDRVVRVNCKYDLFERGTIIDDVREVGLYRILEDSGQVHCWDVDKTELEEVFDSPLYKALT